MALAQARWALTISVGHLASELNTWADALSRLTAPAPAEVPVELRSLPRRSWPEMRDLFKINQPSADHRGLYER